MLFCFQPLDEGIGFVAGESSGGLTLGQTERTACITEILMTGSADEFFESAHLLG